MLPLLIHGDAAFAGQGVVAAVALAQQQIAAFLGYCSIDANAATTHFEAHRQEDLLLLVDHLGHRRGRRVEHELLELGLLKKSDIRKQDPDKPALKKYFMHGVGHPLGLDVHDVGLTVEPFQPGWVLTVEPGIYFIPQLIDQWKAEGRNEAFINYAEVEKFRTARGYRIEDDVVVTEDYETPYILSWENNTWVCRQVELNRDETFMEPIVSKITKFTLGMRGENTDTTVSYEVEGGQVIDIQDIMDYCKKHKQGLTLG